MSVMMSPHLFNLGVGCHEERDGQIVLKVSISGSRPSLRTRERSSFISSCLTRSRGVASSRRDISPNCSRVTSAHDVFVRTFTSAQSSGHVAARTPDITTTSTSHAPHLPAQQSKQELERRRPREYRWSSLCDILKTRDGVATLLSACVLIYLHVCVC